ncbi:MAG: hypothetical protein J6A00_13805 [Bacteroides sp.]|nr:hypothetical protein [Bacteroides sp.]
MIRISERGKLGMWRLLQANDAVGRKGYTPITVFYPSESRGTVPTKR